MSQGITVYIVCTVIMIVHILKCIPILKKVLYNNFMQNICFVCKVFSIAEFAEYSDVCRHLVHVLGKHL